MFVFSPPNIKTEQLGDVHSLSYTAGKTCPYAKLCKSWVENHRIVDGPHCQWRCYGASMEVRCPPLRKRNLHNQKVLRTALKHSKNELKRQIRYAIPLGVRIIRLHVTGDFVSQRHFDAWLEICQENPALHVYAYTKSLPFWVKRLKDIPTNFSLTASYGGTKDALIGEYGLKSATVVFSEAEADSLGLVIDDTEQAACYGDESFALLLHNVQPKGTPAAKAWEKLRREKINVVS